jgi:hypothetical protein
MAWPCLAKTTLENFPCLHSQGWRSDLGGGNQRDFRTAQPNARRGSISSPEPQGKGLRNACTAHLGVPIALSGVADWGGGNLEAKCSPSASNSSSSRGRDLVRRRNAALWCQVLRICRSSRSTFEECPQRGASRSSRSSAGRKQHSGRASGPKSPC